MNCALGSPFYGGAHIQVHFWELQYSKKNQGPELIGPNKWNKKKRVRVRYEVYR